MSSGLDENTDNIGGAVATIMSSAVEGTMVLIMDGADIGDDDDGIAGKSLRGIGGGDVSVIRCWGARIVEC